MVLSNEKIHNDYFSKYLAASCWRAGRPIKPKFLAVNAAGVWHWQSWAMHHFWPRKKSPPEKPPPFGVEGTGHARVLLDGLSHIELGTAY